MDRKASSCLSRCKIQNGPAVLLSRPQMMMVMNDSLLLVLYASTHVQFFLPNIFCLSSNTTHRLAMVAAVAQDVERGAHQPER